VEAIIQLPTDEFFNTNITTYIWVLNKNKSNERKKKVILIDASNKFKLLKKNKGKKRKKIDRKSREDILKTLLEFKDNEYAKVFDREYFYFNKQSIILTNIDIKEKTFEKYLNGKKSLKLIPDKVIQKNENEEIVINEFLIKKFDKDKYDSLKTYHEELKLKLADFNYKEGLKIETNGALYYFDNKKETLIKEANRDKEELGCGKIIIKSSYKKVTKSKPEEIIISVELNPDYEKDYEIIPYSENSEENKRNIEEFMKKYISKPFTYGDNVVGVEINFNKVFYKPEKLRELDVIIEEIKQQDKELKQLEEDLGL
jgi:type I restriction enzyme M protein